MDDDGIYTKVYADTFTTEEVGRIFELMSIVKEHATGKYADYAKTYADATLEAFIVYGDDGIKKQIPYVLANLGGWRGELATKTKKELRSFGDW